MGASKLATRLVNRGVCVCMYVCMCVCFLVCVSASCGVCFCSCPPVSLCRRWNSRSEIVKCEYILYRKHHLRQQFKVCQVCIFVCCHAWHLCLLTVSGIRVYNLFLCVLSSSPLSHTLSIMFSTFTQPLHSTSHHTLQHASRLAVPPRFNTKRRWTNTSPSVIPWKWNRWNKM